MHLFTRQVQGTHHEVAIAQAVPASYLGGVPARAMSNEQLSGKSCSEASLEALRSADDDPLGPYLFPGLLDDFTKYLACFRPVARKLLLKMGEVGAAGLTHEMLSDILEEACQELERVKEEEAEPGAPEVRERSETMAEKDKDAKENEDPLEGSRKADVAPPRKRSRSATYDWLYGEAGRSTPQRTRGFHPKDQNTV